MSTENTTKKEKDLFDLLAIIGGWISSFFRWIGRGCIAILSLTVRHWIVVLLPALIACGLALYINRPSNRYYSAQAIAMLELAPADHDLAQQVYNRLEEAWNVADEELPNNLASILALPQEDARKLRKFKSYDVIANQLDATWVDYNSYAKHLDADDTCTVLMKRQLALSFETKQPKKVSEVEKAILNYMNNDAQLIQKHNAFRKQLEEQHLFISQQIDLLDSVSRAFYASQISNSATYAQQHTTNLVVGRQELGIMSDEIMDLYRSKGYLESEMALCNTPVTLKNGFIVSSKPVRHPIGFPVKLLLLGYIFGLFLGLLADNRKNWWAQLKNK